MTESARLALLKTAGVIFLVIFACGPIFWMLLFSFARHPDFLIRASSFNPTIDNYIQILTNGSLGILHYLINSVIISGIAAALVTAIAFISAYTFTRMQFHFRSFMPLALLAVSMFPQISIIGYLFQLMTWLGWINTYPALIFPYTAIALPLAVWLMMSILSRLPRDLDRAAMIDGASRLQIMRLVIFPIAAPGVVSTLILAFILSFNEFMFALMLTSDLKSRTIPVGIALFTGLHGEIPYGQIMAGAVIATLPVILLAALFQKRIIQGLAGGSIKG
jgi:multiple sugar transport system permease protein